MSILNPLFEAVAWVLLKIHAGLAVPFGASSGLTWVLSIVILVVLMRLILLPLFIKQVKSQQRMQAHMPQMREIQKRYKHDKQRMNEEMMKFYRENGLNPLGGCLPLVAQLPVFWSLFNVLKAIAEWVPGHTAAYGIPVSVVRSARDAKIFGATLADKVLFTGTLHVPFEAKVVILVAVAISATTTFLTMRQSKKRGMLQQGPPVASDGAGPNMQNMQKYMMYIAPLFALTGLYWQFGLVIYWVTTNVWTLGQQYFLFRNLPVVGADADSATAPASGTAASKTAASRGSASKTTSTSAGTASRTGAAKSAPAKAGTASKAGSSSRSASAKTGTKSSAGGRTSAGASGKGSAAGKEPAKRPAAGRTSANGTAAKTAASGTQGGSGARNLLPFGKGKAEPEPEPEPTGQAKVVRQQPSRQSRSKRSGSSSGKR
ncbi:MAG: membrane protein insertase YidC [Nocardiopsaceae bacterium]|nr:membrane protein insertase YidC [Nocardiopsaceae bacterium]